LPAALCAAIEAVGYSAQVARREARLRGPEAPVWRTPGGHHGSDRTSQDASLMLRLHAHRPAAALVTAEWTFN